MFILNYELFGNEQTKIKDLGNILAEDLEEKSTGSTTPALCSLRIIRPNY